MAAVVSYKAGDRVRLTAAGAERYIQPIRGWGKQGRFATVVVDGNHHIRVRFDCKRPQKRPGDYFVNLWANDIELVEGASNG